MMRPNGFDVHPRPHHFNWIFFFADLNWFDAIHSYWNDNSLKNFHKGAQKIWVLPIKIHKRVARPPLLVIFLTILDTCHLIHLVVDCRKNNFFL